MMNNFQYPKVEISFMNDTHAEEVDLVNQLTILINTNQSTAKAELKVEIDCLLDAWLKHTRAHFKREDALMVRVQFPAAEMHMAEHRHALQTLQTVVDDWYRDHDGDCLAQYVLQTWPDWFQNHVSTMDMVTAQYAAMVGFPGDM